MFVQGDFCCSQWFTRKVLKTFVEGIGTNRQDRRITTHLIEDTESKQFRRVTNTPYYSFFHCFLSGNIMFDLVQLFG